MVTKSEMLKELGWSDELIGHFLISDDNETDTNEPELIPEIYDTHSLTVSFSAVNSSSASNIDMIV